MSQGTRNIARGRESPVRARTPLPAPPGTREDDVGRPRDNSTAAEADRGLYVEALPAGRVADLVAERVVRSGPSGRTVGN